VFNNQHITVLFDTENNPWFKGKDVAEVLGYVNSKKAIRDHVREKYRKKETEIEGLNTNYPSKFQHHSVFLSEPGLYQLIISCKLPIAEIFQDWVFEEVLPSIRKHGEYKLRHENQHLFNALTQSLETRRQLQTINDSLRNENQTMRETLNKQTPNVAVIPIDTELQHVFCVLIKETMLEQYGVCEYKCIRTEKRGFHRALAKAKNEGFQPCFIKSPVPNGINILNRAKEVMKDKCMHFDCAFNIILTPHNFVNIVQLVIDQV